MVLILSMGFVGIVTIDLVYDAVLVEEFGSWAI